MSDFKNQSPWGSPPPGGNGNGGFRRGPTPPDIDEIVKKIQNFINRFVPGGKGGSKPIIFGLIIEILDPVTGGHSADLLCSISSG